MGTVLCIHPIKVDTSQANETRSVPQRLSTLYTFSRPGAVWPFLAACLGLNRIRAVPYIHLTWALHQEPCTPLYECGDYLVLPNYPQRKFGPLR